MRRRLAAFLAFIMLFTACGMGQTLAAEGDGAPADTLAVTTHSGNAPQSFAVGDTFTYSYALRITSELHKLDRIRAHVLYDPACLELVDAVFPNFSGEVLTDKTEAGSFYFEKGIILNASQFNNEVLTVVTCTFRVIRGGTAALQTSLKRLEVQDEANSDIYFVKDYVWQSGFQAMFKTYDYLNGRVPAAGTAPIPADTSVPWFYLVDSTTNTPVPEGAAFTLCGTGNDGTLREYAGKTDAYGCISFGAVPRGSYYVTCADVLPDGSIYRIAADSVRVPNVSQNALVPYPVYTAEPIAADALTSLEVGIYWHEEFIDTDIPYDGDRPKSLYLELRAGDKLYARRYVDSAAESVTFRHIPKLDAEGNPITYVLETPNLEHYSHVVTAAPGGFLIDYTYLNDHDWEIVQKDPTCTEKGSLYAVCRTCGTVHRQELAPLGHDYAETGREATCTQGGYKRLMCRRCNHVEEVRTEPLGHDWSEWEVVREPIQPDPENHIEGVDGERSRICRRCGASETQAIHYEGHDCEFHLVTIPPTCTQAGWQEMRCACGKVFRVEGSEVPALGHDYSGDSATTNLIEPTCTKSGLREFVCTRCGEIHSEVIPAHGHNFELIEHKDPTCSEPGYEILVCGFCNEERTVRIPSLGHDWGEWIEDTPATETEEGARHCICRRCGERKDGTIPPLGHVHEYSESVPVPPTCTEKGYTKHCCECGKFIIDEESYTEPLGHDWVETFRKESTEKTHGIVQYRCTRCGLYRYEELPFKPTSWKNPFFDMEKGAWYYNSVAYMVESGYMSGVTATRFDPETPVTRGMFVAVLHRMAGSPQIDNMFHPFEDVGEHYYTDAVKWAYTCRIVSGTTPTTFSPEQLVTREQMVAMLYRYTEFQGCPTDNRIPLDEFSDAAAVSKYARTPMEWAAASHIIYGNAGRLLPGDVATRAEAAAVLERFDKWRFAQMAGE